MRNSNVSSNHALISHVRRPVILVAGPYTHPTLPTNAVVELAVGDALVTIKQYQITPILTTLSRAYATIYS